MSELPARLAAETWRASGDRTIERLHALVEHFASVYHRPEDINILKAQALTEIPEWMRPQ